MNPNQELKDQEAFEGKPFTTEDEKLYQLLFDELENDPELDIKPQFSAAIVKKLDKRRRKESRGEFFIFGFAIIGVMFVTVLAASFAKQAFQNSPEFLRDSPLAPALAFAGLLILFQFIDKRYLKDHRIKRRLRQG